MPLTSTAHLNHITPLNTTLFRESQLKSQLKEALHILLTTHNPPEDYSTYLQLLKTCILKNALAQGKNIHSFITHRRFAFATCTAFLNKLTYMYVKCGCLVDARKVFDNMKERDCVSWNTIIAAYRRHRFPHEAVTLFHHMQQTGLQPDRFTFASVLPACAKMGALEQGMDIHKNIKDRGLLSDVVIATALVDMYAKCGSIDKARELFDRMPPRNSFSWNALIAGQNGFVENTLQTFKQMQFGRCKARFYNLCLHPGSLCRMGALEQGYEQNGFVDEDLETFKQMELVVVKSPFSPPVPKWELWNTVWTSIKAGGFCRYYIWKCPSRYAWKKWK